MNIYISTILDFYDMYIRCVHFLSYIFLYMFHNQILYIKYVNDDDKISYIVPLLQLCFHNKYIPGVSVYNPFEKLELCYVSYIKDSHIEYLACSECCIFDIQIKINHLNHNENYEKRHAIAKKYIFVEIGNNNVTESFKKIGWSLVDEEISVGEYKRIIELPDDDATLDLTDADNLDIHELKNNDVIV